MATKQITCDSATLHSHRHLQAAATYLLIQPLPTRTCCWTASPALPELVCWLVSFSCLQHICHPATWSWTELAGRLWQIRHLFSAHGAWQAAGASQSRQARDVQPFAHPLSNAASLLQSLSRYIATATPAVVALPKSFSATFPPYPSTCYCRRWSCPGHSIALLLQSCLFSLISFSRTTAHTSLRPIASPTHLPSSPRIAGWTVVAAAGRAWEGDTLNESVDSYLSLRWVSAIQLGSWGEWATNQDLCQSNSSSSDTFSEPLW